MEFYGDSTRWFMGVIKDIKDPLRMGRVRVRIFGIHSDNEDDIPDNKLPWAQVLTPATEEGVDGLGNILGIQTKARVFGIFLDGTNSQMPLVLGSVPHSENYTSSGGQESEVTTNINAQGLTNEVQDSYQDDAEAFDDTKVVHEPFDHETKKDTTTVAVDDGKGEMIDEPKSENVETRVYPNNKVRQTTSGHVLEIDDTPSGERLRVFHKSGTFVEMQPNGDVVTRHANGFRTVTGNDKLYVTGDVEWIVEGNLNLSVLKDINIFSQGAQTYATDTTLEYSAKGNIIINTDASYLNTNADTYISGTTSVDIRSARVDLNAGDPGTPVTKNFQLKGIESPENATAGGMGNMPYDDDGNALGPSSDGGPMSDGGDYGPPGDCTRKNLGSVSSQFEANNDPGAVSGTAQANTDGYSYGSYQIATKPGTMNKFINYLNATPKYADYGARLNSAGGNSAASNRDSQFVSTWQQMSYDNPEGDDSFKQAQHDYIQASHYDVAVKKVKEATGIDACSVLRSNGLQDAIWSTSVQHGPNAVTGIVKNAIARTGKTADTVTDAELVAAIYDERGANNGMKYFHKSRSDIRSSVVDRFKIEKAIAVNETSKIGLSGAAAPTTGSNWMAYEGPE